ncbi:hypothetical protein [Streptomyces bambusae]|uniref:Uncharacterized protein n=1 Tax=Streptomyces bambusae TaxID=1550616 RepID=A0ABS6Z446_9ACTN|nr:hypothetical protein [Streptomyces bambusae]MBW5482477.1 hypothetical protein [Streptomyces bambusae]
MRSARTCRSTNASRSSGGPPDAPKTEKSASPTPRSFALGAAAAVVSWRQTCPQPEQR